MSRITYKGQLPSPEQFRKDLREAEARANPVDDLLDLWNKLQHFEQKHKLPSADFYRQFQAGTLDDTLQHCLSWAATYEIFLKARRRIEVSLMRAAITHEVEV